MTFIQQSHLSVLTLNLLLRSAMKPSHHVTELKGPFGPYLVPSVAEKLEAE